MACLRSLANVAAMDVKRFQTLCKGEVNKGWEVRESAVMGRDVAAANSCRFLSSQGGGGYLEFNYVCNVILSAPLDAAVEECLKWCVVLIGLYVVCNPNNQQRLHWGGGGEGQTLLSKLSSMPFQYFCDPSKKEVLFPTLIVACLDNETNKAAIEDDLNPEVRICDVGGARSEATKTATGARSEATKRCEYPVDSLRSSLTIRSSSSSQLLACFLRGKMRAVESGGEGGEEEKEGWKKAVQCSKRCPTELWRSAVEFFT